jgi:hypothetical protein
VAQEQEVSLDQFKVLMQELADATSVVDTQRKNIETLLVDLQDQFGLALSYWRSPAADTLELLTKEYQADVTSLNELLADIVSRMRKSYTNYVAVEKKAEQNLSSSQSSSPSGAASAPRTQSTATPRTANQTSQPAGGAGSVPRTKSTATPRTATPTSQPASMPRTKSTATPRTATPTSQPSGGAGGQGG